MYVSPLLFWWLLPLTGLFGLFRHTGTELVYKKEKKEKDRCYIKKKIWAECDMCHLKWAEKMGHTHLKLLPIFL